jgi:hypothetical protein
MTWSRYAKLEAYETTAFNPHRGPVDPAACAKALGPYGGFWGWWIECQSPRHHDGAPTGILT